jgi:hypothetical protein
MYESMLFCWQMNHFKMIDPTYVSTGGVLWCATHKYILLVIESRSKISHRKSDPVDDDMAHSE